MNLGVLFDRKFSEVAKVFLCGFFMLWHTAKTSATALYYFATRKDLRPAITDLGKRWAHSLLKEADVRFEVHNASILDGLAKGRPVVFMSNHASMVDIPLSLVAFQGDVRMLAKKEMLYYPLLGPAMKASEFLFVNRRNTRAAIEDLRIAKEKMVSGIRLWIYPEGTRSSDGRLLPFKKGGFHLAVDCQAIIVPVAIVGAKEVIARNSLVVHPSRKVEIFVGSPVDTLTLGDKNPAVAARSAVEKSIREFLGQMPVNAAGEP